MIEKTQKHRHPDAGRGPLHSTKVKEIRTHWIPAFAGMTGKVRMHVRDRYDRKKHQTIVIATSRLRRTNRRPGPIRRRGVPHPAGWGGREAARVGLLFFCHPCEGRDRVYEIYNIQTCVICIILARYAHTARSHSCLR